MFPTPASTRWSSRASPIARRGRLRRAARARLRVEVRPQRIGAQPRDERPARKLRNELAGRRPDEVGRDFPRRKAHPHRRPRLGHVRCGAGRTSRPSRGGRARRDRRSSDGRGACRRRRRARTAARRADPPPSRSGPAASSRRRGGPRSPACGSARGGGSCFLRAFRRSRSSSQTLPSRRPEGVHLDSRPCGGARLGASKEPP